MVSPRTVGKGISGLRGLSLQFLAAVTEAGNQVADLLRPETVFLRKVFNFIILVAHHGSQPSTPSICGSS